MLNKTKILMGLGCLVLAFVSSGQTVIRGPYLQQSTMHEVTVCWRSDASVTSQVFYGSTPTNLMQSVVGVTAELNHELMVTNLLEDTRYYYRVAGQVGTFSNQYFKTHPSSTFAGPTRIWAIGDFGTGGTLAHDVKNSYLNTRNGEETDVWLLLGDIAYENGTDAQFDTGLFNVYSELIPNTVMWPTRGNHERDAGVYYAVFDTPSNGEAGGVISGSEAYYSFNYGDIHFVCLDSYETPRGTGDAMLQWLQTDLASATQEWIVAFFHHPPYSKGSHNSDSLADSQGRLVEMRVNALPILEAGGVDLVLSGHSHSYERSKYIENHYGFSDSFDAGEMMVDDGDGAVSGDGAYVAGARAATVYTVLGSSGAKLNAVAQHPVMQKFIPKRGSVMLEIANERLKGCFLDIAGVTNDVFEIWHGHAGRPQIALGAPAIADGTNETALLSGELIDTGVGPSTVELYYGFSDEGPVEALWDHSISLGVQPGTGVIQSVVSNLPPEQDIAYRYFASNASGGVWSAAAGHFTTAATYPILRTEAPEFLSIDPFGATLTMEVVSTGGAPSSVWVFYGLNDGLTNPSLWSHAQALPEGSEGFSEFTVDDLVPDSRYYYRLYGFNSFGESWAPISATFLTPLALPRIQQRASTAPALARHPLIDKGSRWAYWDRGSLPAANWNSTNYNPSTWSVGAAQLGYGQEGIATTTLSFGGDPTNKFITSYFIKSFYNALPVEGVSLKAALRRDDGAVLYLNGSPLLYSNIDPVGVGYATFATVPVGNADELQYFTFDLPSTHLQKGRNVLAAEIHQVSLTSSDLSFDLELQSEDLALGPVWGATNVTHEQAEVLGDLLIDGRTSTVTRLYYGWTDGGTNAGDWDFTTPQIETSLGLVSTVLTNLVADTPYFVRWWASNSYGEAWASTGAIFKTSWAPNNDFLDDDWEQLYFGGDGVSAGGPDQDFDGDGLSDADEQRAGTSPVDPLSSLNLYVNAGFGSTSFSWDAVPGRVYRLEFTPLLTPTSWIMVESNLSIGVITNINLSNTRGYYRIGTQFPEMP